ncbi:MAG TPA: GNAT family N-acetyltransferase [Pyrinomonadaceae bacterium]|nr:GNAT family N-acetyltransferase [Pyrinomonadaceae bacterium]
MEEIGVAETRDVRPPVTLRPVTTQDREFLVKVYASTRADEMALVDWDEATKDAFVRQQFEAQHQQYSARYPDARYQIVLYAGEPAGRIWVGEDETQIRLLDIALLPEYRNRRVGAALLADLLEEAARARKPLRHMVFKFNPDATRFYERLGFRPIEDVGAYIHMEYLPDEGQGET